MNANHASRTRTNASLRALAATAAAALALTGSAAAQGDVGEPECPVLGVQADLLSLTSGGHVLNVQLRLAGDETELPTVATVEADGNLLAQVPLLWSRIDFFCCCSSQLLGEMTLLLPRRIAAGTAIHVSLGSHGSQTVVVPGPTGTVRPASAGRRQPGVVRAGDRTRP